MLLYWSGLSVFLLMLGYRDSFLLINGWHRPFFDWPMFLLTHLGDGLILTSLLALIFGKKHSAMIINMILAVIILGLFGQLLKNTWFEGWDRPFRIFDSIADVHSVAGYRMFHNSFPSGHSIVVSAVISTYVLSSKPGWILQAVLAFAIMLISYTRIYVGVHFPGDVLVGTLIGFLGAWLLSLTVYPRVKKWLDNLSPPTIKRLNINLLIVAGIGLVLGIVLVILSLNHV
jgi:undecaprenyl-diphosphatase